MRTYPSLGSNVSTEMTPVRERCTPSMMIHKEVFVMTKVVSFVEMDRREGGEGDLRLKLNLLVHGFKREIKLEFYMC